MQGISVLTNQQGKPKTLTIDVEQHDNQLEPFVQGILDLLQHQAEEQERREFFDTSGLLANRAYSDDEPDYTVNDLKWVNPTYSPDAIY